MKKIVSLLCAVLLSFSMASCGAKEQPNVAVEKFCGALKAFDLETMATCTVNGNEDIIDWGDDEFPAEVYDVLKENAGKITYTVGEPLVTEDTGEVTVDFVYPDVSEAIASAMGEILEKAFAMAFSGADEDAMDTMFEEVLIEKLENTPATTATVSIQFECIVTEDGWKIESVGDDVMNVMTSNMVKAFEEATSDNTESSDEDMNWHDTSIGEEVTLATLKLKVVDCNEQSTIKSDWGEKTAQEGTKYIVFTVNFENTTKEAIILDGSDFPFYDNQDRAYTTDDDAMFVSDSALSYKELAPNIPATYTLIYNVPMDCDGYYFAASNADSNDAYRFFGQ